MALSVIGAGMGRTGTYSLNIALEILGFGPCHHMDDVNRSQDQKAFWRAAGRGKRSDWDTAYEGFRSAVDWPTAYFWRELAAFYPDAKVILTRRSPESWYKSMLGTLMEVAGPGADPNSFGVAIVHDRILGGRVDDAAHCMEVFERHNADVIAAIAPERLLVFQSTDGWPPLCAFLGVATPEQPYPATNSTEEFRAHFLGRNSH